MDICHPPATMCFPRQDRIHHGIFLSGSAAAAAAAAIVPVAIPESNYASLSSTNNPVLVVGTVGRIPLSRIELQRVDCTKAVGRGKALVDWFETLDVVVRDRRPFVDAELIY